MTSLRHCSFLLCMFLFLGGCQPPEDKLQVMTFNIRWASPDDGVNVWENRRYEVIKTILDQAPDVAGLQEVTREQLEDLIAGSIGYDYCGVGRDDGKKAGEYSPLFFRIERFERLQDATIWLSSTPGQPGSVGWDAALPRIATWAELRDKKTGDTLFVCNTHFDHIGRRARAESARQLLDLLAKQPKHRQVILMGDFNATPADKPYRILADDLQDAREVSEEKPSGPPRTYNAWGAEREDVVIDHIFLNDGLQVEKFSVLEIHQDSLYVSDHWPVVATLKHSR